MSTIDVGAQSIMATFQMPATAALFNRQFRDTIKPGIYAGGLVTIVAANSIQIAEFVSVIRSLDLVGDKAVRLQTADPVILNVPNAPNGDYTLYLTYTYNAVLTNFADFNIRLTSSPAVTGEVVICRVVNNGVGIATSIEYDTRTRGSIDVDLGDRLTTDADPTQNYHVGNRAYNDLRYANHNGPSNWDLQILKSSDGTLNSRLWFDGLASRDWELPDRSGTVALHYSAIRVGMIMSSLEVITPSADAPWLDISQDHLSLAASGAGSWPILVPFLRTLSGGSGYVVTGYTSGVSTVLQMDSGDAATAAFVLALYEDNLYHGDGVENYTNYKTITIATAFGDIVAGDYNIVDIDPVLFRIEIDAATAGPSAPGTIDHYPFRIKSSSTTARWFRVTDSVVTTSGSEYIPAFRARDRIQIHKHTDTGHSHGILGFYVVYVSNSPWPGSVYAYVGDGGGNTGASAAAITDPVTTLTPGFDAIRYGNTTRTRLLATRAYMFGGVFDA